MTIEEAIESVADCVRVGVHERLIVLTLVSEGFSQEKASIILRWAKQHKKAKKVQ